MAWRCQAARKKTSATEAGYGMAGAVNAFGMAQVTACVFGIGFKPLSDFVLCAPAGILLLGLLYSVAVCF